MERRAPGRYSCDVNEATKALAHRLKDEGRNSARELLSRNSI